MIVSLAAMLLATTPAERFDRDVDCVLRRMSAAERAEIVDEAIGRPTENGHLSLLDAQDRCEAPYRNNLYAPRETNAHWIAVVTAAMAVILREGLGDRLESAGIAPRLVDDWFVALPPGVRTTTAMDRAVRDSLIDYLLGRGIPQAAIDANSTELDNYRINLVTQARIAAGLNPMP
jgi:hypothetical protein